MKKILLSIIILALSAVMVQAQGVQAHASATSPLVEQAGSYFFCGDLVMDHGEFRDFLSTRNQPAYEKFNSGYKCYLAGWSLLGVGLAVDLAGSIVWAFQPEDKGEKASASTIAGATLVIAGSCAILAALPTIYIGYVRMYDSVDMYNVAQRTSATQAYWTIQGSENGIGLALNF